MESIEPVSIGHYDETFVAKARREPHYWLLVDWHDLHVAAYDTVRTQLDNVGLSKTMLFVSEMHEDQDAHFCVDVSVPPLHEQYAQANHLLKVHAVDEVIIRANVVLWSWYERAFAELVEELRRNTIQTHIIGADTSVQTWSTERGWMGQLERDSTFGIWHGDFWWAGGEYGPFRDLDELEENLLALASKK